MNLEVSHETAARLVAQQREREAVECTPRTWRAERMAAERMARLFIAEASGRDVIGPRNTSVCLIPAALAVPGIHRQQIGPCPVLPGAAPESSDELALFALNDPRFAAPASDLWPEYTECRRQAALRAVFETISEREANEAETRLAASIESPAAESVLFGPGLSDEQFCDESEAVGEFADYFEGQADFRELTQNETGRVIAAETASKRWEAMQTDVAFTNRLADCLEAAGMPVYYANPGEPNPECRPVRPAVSLVPVGEPEKAITMPNVRRLNAFPLVARARRAEIIRGLRYILQNEQFARMATITSGSRTRAECRLGTLRIAHKQFRAALGAVLDTPIARRHIETLFLGIEYGTPKAVPVDLITAEITFHIHGHLLYVPRLRWDGRTWSRLQWSRFRKWFRLRMAAEMRGWVGQDRERGLTDADGVHMELGELIDDPAEVCKYPFKGADLAKLIDLAGPPGIRTFFEQVRGLNYAQPLGRFRDLRRKLKLDGKRFCVVSTPDGPIVEIRRNWNLSRFDGYGARDRRNQRAKTRRGLRPEVIARRKRREAAAFAARVRRPLWRIHQIGERLAKAEKAITAGRALAYWQAVSTAYKDERAALFREVRELMEARPVTVSVEGVADYLAAPWLADLRAYLGKCGFRSDYDAQAASGIWISPDAAEREINDKESRIKDNGERGARPPLRNHLMARCAPFASGAWRVSQPVLAVIGWNGDFDGLREQSRDVAALADETREHIAAALRVTARLDAMPDMRGEPLTHTRDAGARAFPVHTIHLIPKGGGGDGPPIPELWPRSAEKMAAMACN